MLKRCVWKYDDADYIAFNRAIAAYPWHVLQLAENVDIACSEFYRIFNTMLEQYVPHHSVTVHPKDKPWFTPELRRLIRKRNILRRVVLKSGRDHDTTKYKQLTLIMARAD
jgi:hypothetical protein